MVMGRVYEDEFRARQQDLTTECDGLLIQDELKLANKFIRRS